MNAPHLLAPLPTLEQRQARLEADIVVAWELVKAARARHAHSPNADREQDAKTAEAELNVLLERYHSLGLERIAEAIVTP